MGVAVAVGAGGATVAGDGDAFAELLVLVSGSALQAANMNDAATSNNILLIMIILLQN